MVPAKRKTAKQAAGLLLLAVVFGAGYFTGQFWRVIPEDGGYKVQYLAGQDDDKPERVDFSRFWTAWSVADQGYYGRNDKNDRVNGAIAGMLASLGDPYTNYLPREENELFQTDLTGTFSGIGAEISPINGWPTVVAPLKGSPAERAGIKAKDVIIKVNDKDTEQENFAEVINRIRGMEGTAVTLSVAREGEAEPLVFKVVREKIELPNVSHEVADDNGFKYCFVQISQFIDTTDRKVTEALDDCGKQGVTRAIIDLRNNPGGLLDSVISLTSRFVDVAKQPQYEKAIVWQKDRDDKTQVYAADQEAKYADWSLVLLVNEGSASASEIMAGALQDYGQAKLVGTKTFGKGSVQELRDLSDGSSIKLTVAKWLTPNKKEIDHQGVSPDVTVAAETSATEAKDSQREAAVTALRSR